MPLIQISTYPQIVRRQKELFAKVAIANAALEILKGKLRYVIVMANDQRREHSENWYYSGEQSSEEQHFEIPG